MGTGCFGWTGWAIFGGQGTIDKWSTLWNMPYGHFSHSRSKHACYYILNLTYVVKCRSDRLGWRQHYLVM